MSKNFVSGFLPVLALLPLAPATAQGFPSVPVPDRNPITTAKVLLGKALFWDEQLSSTGTVACGTCHMPAAGGTDPRVLFPAPGVPGTVNPGPDGWFGTADDVVASPGVPANLDGGGYVASAWGLAPQVTGRKAPSMINAAFHRELFWDGRGGEQFLDPITGALVLDGKAALESQAAGPPVSSVEMGHAGVSWTGIEARLAAVVPLALASDVPAPLAAFVAGRTYPQLFATAFGGPEVTAARIAMAIATYERTLVADDSRFDRWNNGQDPQWLTAQEVRGHDVFLGAGNCRQCHAAPFFSDDNFHRLGVRPPFEDVGRAAVTGHNGDRGKFKTPSLRNVGLHRHFMHNGAFATLAEVVEFYDRGGDFPAQISPLGLSAQQKADLVAFLHTLTDDRVANRLPPFDRPTLYSATNRVPAEYGYGTAGSGGFVPDAVAIEPPHLGNARFTVGVDDGLGGAFAALVLDLAPAPVGGYPLQGVQVFLGGAGTLVPYGLVRLAGSGAGAGWGSLVVPLPATANFGGTTVYLQWAAFDAGGPQGITASAAVRFTLF